jgi:hypothetical protein
MLRQMKVFIQKDYTVIELSLHSMSELQELQENVCGPHMRLSFATKLRNTLRFVDNHPDAASRTGLIPFGPNSFLVNSKICSQFFGIKPNSCNRNFQQHQFGIDFHYQITQACRDRYPNIQLSQRTWPRRTFKYGQFNGDSSDEEIAVATIEASRQRGLFRFNHEQAEHMPILGTPLMSNDGQGLFSGDFGDGGEFDASWDTSGWHADFD